MSIFTIFVLFNCFLRSDTAKLLKNTHHSKRKIQKIIYIMVDNGCPNKVIKNNRIVKLLCYLGEWRKSINFASIIRKKYVIVITIVTH